MFWADTIVEDILKTSPEKKEFIIRDEKTPSGRVHIGSVRGVMVHGIIAQILEERGKKVRFIYEFNDFDPMDGLPIYLEKAKYKPEMGKSLKDIPSPDPVYKNYAECFGAEFLEVIQRSGFFPETPRAFDLYKEGKMNKWLRLALTKNTLIRNIYKKVSGSEKDEHWCPVQVLCEQCGKIGTTDVKSFDGEQVTYVCESEKVTWARGCGHTGTVSPFDGRAQLTWKVEWPAKWAAYNVDIEGAGKDHCAAGGSRDVGEALCKEVFNIQAPFNIPYEFFLINGAKMSSSKGEGATAKAVSDLIPPELFRFLMLRIVPTRPINFEAEGETIPRLFDEYDRAAEQYFLKEDSSFPDLGRVFELSQLPSDTTVQQHYLPRFSKLVFALQIPRLDIFEEVEKWKGSTLTEADRAEIILRKEYAEKWIQEHAPAKYLFQLSDDLPEATHSFTEDQKDIIRLLSTKLKKISWEGESIHGVIHEVKTELEIEPKALFPLLYMTFLGRESGPQMGWFLSTLEKDWVMKRLQKISEMK